MEKTKICVACFKSIPDGARICPLCGTEQPGPGNRAAQDKLRSQVSRLRYVYIALLAALVVFMGSILYKYHGKESAQESCNAAQKYGIANMQDCLKEMKAAGTN